jgi:hypothetical protein
MVGYLPWQNIAKAIGRAMKIYLLLMLIGVIVGFSYLPFRRPTTVPSQKSPDSIAASV